MLDNVLRPNSSTRRDLLAAMAGAGLALLAGRAFAQAQPPTGTGNTDSQVVGADPANKDPMVSMEQANALSWLVGDKLSLAAILYAQGGSEEEVASYRDMAVDYAGALHFAIRPFPDGKPTVTLAQIMQYLLEGDGSQLGVDLGQRFGYTAGLLYEVAVNSNILIVLYAPGDDSGLGALIQDRCTKLSLPAELWTPLTDAIAAKQSAEQVNALLFSMHDGIGQYLVKRAGFQSPP